MRAISSSILVLAGAVIIGAAVVANPHDPMREPTIAFGFLFSVIGLVGWFLSFRNAK